MRRPTVRRTDPRLQIIREAIERLIPGSTPAFLNVELTETFPLARRASVNTWTGTPASVADRIFTALYGRPRVSAEDAEREQLQTITRVLTEPQVTGPPVTHDTEGLVLHLHNGSAWQATVEQVAEAIHTALLDQPVTAAAQSPLAQAEDAKRRRDLGAEIGVLTSAHNRLTSAPWYPVRPGDLVHIHYEQGGESPAFGETYIVSGDDGSLSMQLLAHTLPGSEGDPAAYGLGCFAIEDTDDPLYTAWFEAGPQRLTIVRDGQVVHGNLARPQTDAAAAGTKLAAMTMAAAIRQAEQYLERNEPELALARLRSDVSLAPCGAPGFTAEQADCARPSGHRGACSDNADYIEPPHECPTLPEQLHAVVYVDHPGRSVRFGGLYADEGVAVEVANDAAYGYGSALTETTPGPGGQPLVLLPAEGVAGVPVVAVVGLQLLPDPREADWRDEEGRDACAEYDPDYGKDLDYDDEDDDRDGGE